ncbi:hypothetical protein DTO271G3_7271 [Paecilomyces variotii]|nr:hypothetical protein DTO271G3_7271 [Paecilomyces variotii]
MEKQSGPTPPPATRSGDVLPAPAAPMEDEDNRDNGPLDGGFKAWAVVAGGLINYCATFGLLNSFGTFQTYYQNDLLEGTSPSAISVMDRLDPGKRELIKHDV